VIKGEWKYGVPIILGHEAAGVVEAVGPNVTGLKEGDRRGVVVPPRVRGVSAVRAGALGPVRGLHGRPLQDARWHRPRAPEWPDLPVLGRMGSFAEKVVMPAEQVVPVTQDISMEELALIGCAVTTGVGAVVNAAKVEPGSTVAVIGCGGVGLNVIQGAALVNASRIIAVDLLDNKLEYARQFGATDTVNAGAGWTPSNRSES